MSTFIPKEPISFGIFATKPQRKWAITALLAVVIGSGVDKVSIVILRNLSDAIAHQPLFMNSVWLWAIAYPLVFLMAQTIWRISGFSGMRWFMGLRVTGYQALYDYLTLHSKDYFNSRFAGSLVNKIANAVDGTERLFENILWRFLSLILGILWYVIFISFNNVWFGVIIVLWSIVFFGINIWFAQKLQPYAIGFADSLSTLKGRVVDSLSNMSLVHEYANVTGERKYIKSYINKQHDKGLLHWWIAEWVLVANGFLVTLFILLMVGTAVYLFQIGAVSIGVVVMVIVIVGDLSSQLFFIGSEIKDAAGYYGEAKEGLEEILQQHFIIDATHAAVLSATKGTIALHAIDFEYENTKVFNNFSLTIPTGQKVGIVGRSGAGKTTFVSLLLRHFDVQKGEITIDDQNISQVTLESLRRAIAFVPQDTSLFHRTIAENIRYGNPDATDDELHRAARLAQAETFITRLPKGYETLVGERGVKLSGGQRQRIAIARAFLKNAPILILDEATSSLDSESEQAIQLALDELMKERTVIAIAHRLSTLKKMDRIVIFDEGKVVEDGSPEILLNKSGSKFKKMWDHQVKGFILDE